MRCILSAVKRKKIFLPQSRSTSTVADKKEQFWHQNTIHLAKKNSLDFKTAANFVSNNNVKLCRFLKNLIIKEQPSNLKMRIKKRIVSF